MRSHHRSATVVAVACAIAAASLQVPLGRAQGQISGGEAAPRPEEIAAGKALFNSVGCWSCHGFDGQGATSRGIASGPRINARVLPQAAFLQQLRSPMNVMPPYTSKVLSDEDAARIFAYLKSVPVPLDSKDIVLLRMPQK